MFRKLRLTFSATFTGCLATRCIRKSAMTNDSFKQWLADPSRRPLVMGVLNVTPDSFSDGGRFADTSAAIAHAREMVEAGADLIDIGGESTRPGSEPVSADEQI